MNNNEKGEWPPKSNKTPRMQKVVSSLLGFDFNIYDRPDCGMCGHRNLMPSDFRDELSIKEFGVSRMCQACQDAIFSTK